MGPVELRDSLADLHENPRLSAPFTYRYPGLTPEEGYAAAQALHRRRLAAGWRPVGRKIGFTNRAIWPRYGVYEPIWGRVYDRTFVTSRGNAAAIPLQGLLQPRIEPEICFGLKATPRSAAPGDLLRAIEWVAHSVEIVQCHHPDWKMKLADCCAGNGLHGRLTVGEHASLESIPDLESSLPLVQVILKKATETKDRGVGANVLGSPLLALGYLVGVLEKQGKRLEAGELVTTGTLTDAYPVAPGESWSTELSGLPLSGLKLQFR